MVLSSRRLSINYEMDEPRPGLASYQHGLRRVGFSKALLTLFLHVHLDGADTTARYWVSWNPYLWKFHLKWKTAATSGRGQGFGEKQASYIPLFLQKGHIGISCHGLDWPEFDAFLFLSSSLSHEPMYRSGRVSLEPNTFSLFVSIHPLKFFL